MCRYKRLIFVAYEVRPIMADEFPAFVRTTALAFGE